MAPVADEGDASARPDPGHRHAGVSEACHRREPRQPHRHFLPFRDEDLQRRAGMGKNVSTFSFYHSIFCGGTFACWLLIIVSGSMASTTSRTETFCKNEQGRNCVCELLVDGEGVFGATLNHPLK